MNLTFDKAADYYWQQFVAHMTGCVGETAERSEEEVQELCETFKAGFRAGSAHSEMSNLQ